MGHPETYTDSSKRRKSLSQPLAQIIETFHRIKEERFKPRLDHSCNSPYDGRKSRDQFDHFTNRVKFADDTDIIQLDGSKTSLNWRFGDVSNGRRVSLPSLFHPFSPTADVTIKEKQVDDSKGYHLTHSRRRHSVSHVMVEYSKHDLEKLAKQHELKLGQINNEQKVKLGVKLGETDNEPPRWMNGKDLHAFYNGWESRYLKPKRLGHSKRGSPQSEYDGSICSRDRNNSF